MNTTQTNMNARQYSGPQSSVPRTASLAKIVLALITFLALLSGAHTAFAQAGLDRMIFMGGTTVMDAQGRHWAYLSWQATEAEELRARMFAVYGKVGDASSAAPYSRLAIVGIQTDPIVLQPLLERSVHLGQNLVELEQTINNLFETLMPDMSLPLADKVSAVIRGSLDHPEHFKNLILMARLHPAMGMALGWSHAEMISGPVGSPTTFELRAYDMAADQDRGVVGRVTVRAGQPLVLPAPGAPVEVPDISPRGDLNARMRWSSPDALRRVSLMQHGFNVYRLPRQLVEDNNYHVAPPSTAELLALTDSDPFVHRLNDVPVLALRNYSEAEALDLAGDPETFFYSDWNDRFNPATDMPQDDFVNGAQFYYFLTARDLLSRDGEVSPGTLMTICDRMPPPAPRRLRVVNHYEYDGVSGQQHLQLIWRQNQNTLVENTTAYYIYRWTSLTQFHAHAGDPGFNLVAGPIAHIDGSSTNSYLDNGPGAPTAGVDDGRTFWYTVVAEDEGACAPGPNRGPHSAMAYGVLRDREGPNGGGGGRVDITCVLPEVVHTGLQNDLPRRDLNTNAYHYDLTTTRQDSRIIWAEYFYDIPGIVTEPVFVGRQEFAPNEDVSVLPFMLEKAGLPAEASPRIRCRVGSNSGKVSGFAMTSFVGIPGDGTVRPVLFEADVIAQRRTPDGDCDIHDPHGEDDDGGSIDDICVTAFLAAGTKEIKFYRRVENGPLTLVCQQEADFDAGETTAMCCDGGIPAQPSDICYFVQLFDEHGNSGPMIRIGCVETAPNAPLPTPILSPLASLGTSTNAQVKIQWACAPYGVERFEVWVTANPLPPGKDFSDDLTLTNEVQIGVPLPPGVLPQTKLLQYLTRRVGPSFGEGSLFTVEADVVPGNRYAVFVKAVGKDGSVGPRSNVESYAWNTTNSVVDNVPWPDRPLPAVTLTNFPHVVAKLFKTNDFVFNFWQQQAFEGVGIRVGELSSQAPVGMTNVVFDTQDPIEHVYHSQRDLKSLFPLVVYRVQETNAAYPEVSGDVVQVTPLMEQIAFDRAPVPGGLDALFVYDPFIRLVPKDATIEVENWELYLLDTQPVLEDATYRYVMVRLHEETREIVEVIPTNPVLITPGS